MKLKKLHCDDLVSVKLFARILLFPLSFSLSQIEDQNRDIRRDGLIPQPGT